MCVLLYRGYYIKTLFNISDHHTIIKEMCDKKRKKDRAAEMCGRSSDEKNRFNEYQWRTLLPVVRLFFFFSWSWWPDVLSRRLFASVVCDAGQQHVLFTDRILHSRPFRLGYYLYTIFFFVYSAATAILGYRRESSIYTTDATEWPNNDVTQASSSISVYHWHI